jgi:hypothetical protein
VAESLQVDEARLRALVPEFEDIGADAQRTLDQLKAALAREGEPWGKDAPGQSFAETYNPDAEKAIASLAKTVASLREEGKLITDLADNFDNQDRSSARLISDAGQSSPNNSPNAGSTAPTDPYSQGWQTPIEPTNSAPASTRTPTESQPDTGYQPAPTSTTTPSSPSSAQPYPSSTAPAALGNPYGNGMPGGPFGDTAGSPSARDTSDSRPGSARTTGNSTPASGIRPAVSVAGADQKSPNTPWSTGTAGTGAAADSPAPKAAAAAPAQISAPGNTPPRVSAPSNMPRMSSPYLPEQQAARPAPKAAGKAFGAESKSAARHPWAADGAAAGENALLARKLADRHDIELVGFDDPSVDGYTIREVAAALDDVLTQYPYVDLRQIAITESADAATRLEWDWVAGATGPEPFTRRIVLDTVLARNPAVFAEYVRTATQSGKLARGSDRRPVYSTMVRELGHALDVAGSFRARQAAQDALIAEFTRTRGTAPRENAATGSNSEYEQWRAQLSGYGFHGDRFDPGMAVADAFTEVQINGAEAAAPAKVLHRLLVDTARKTATP